jgi:WD40 repeat protein
MRLHSAQSIVACWICFCAQLAGAAEEKARRTLVLQAPPATSVDSVAVSPDGSLVATAGGEGGVRLYNAKSGELLRTIGEVGDRDVVFSPDGRLLAAAGFHMDKIVGVYDVQTGKRVLALAGQTEWEADATVFSPDGKLLASTGTDKQILVWELATGKLVHQLKNQPYRLAALAFSPDIATLAGGGGDRQIRLWDMKTGELRSSFTGHRDWIASVAYSPSGKTIASASCNWGFHRSHGWELPAGSPAEQSEWRLWDVDSGKLLRTVGATGRMLCVTISPGGTSLACGIDQEVRLFDLAGDGEGRVVARHDATVTSIAFTPDGEAIVSGSHDQTVKRTNLATRKVEWRAPGYFEQVNSVALSDDGSLLVTGSSDHRFARGKLQAGEKHIGPGAVRLWDARTSRMLRRLGEPAEQVMAVALSADARQVAAGGAIAGGGFVNVWDTATGKLAWSTKDPTKEVLAVDFSTDGRWLAAGAADGLAWIYDARTGSLARSLGEHKGGVTSLAFSRDGETLVCGEAHGGALIWNARTGRLVHPCPAANSAADGFTIDRLMNSIGLSRDGTTLATCASSVNNEFVDPVRIWDVRTGKVTRDFAAEKIHGRPMALSPDGSIVATGGKSVKLWDVRSGTMLRELFGHLKRTQSIVFSADGRLVFAGGSYGTTNVWDVASGRHLITLFAFADDGRQARADDWLAYTPEGYYDGSPGIERYLAWRIGADLVTAKTLGPELHRPDRIESALQATGQQPASR